MAEISGEKKSQTVVAAPMRVAHGSTLLGRLPGDVKVLAKLAAAEKDPGAKKVLLELVEIQRQVIDAQQIAHEQEKLRSEFGRIDNKLNEYVRVLKGEKKFDPPKGSLYADKPLTEFIRQKTRKSESENSNEVDIRAARQEIKSIALKIIQNYSTGSIFKEARGLLSAEQLFKAIFYLSSTAPSTRDLSEVVSIQDRSLRIIEESRKGNLPAEAQSRLEEIYSATLLSRIDLSSQLLKMHRAEVQSEFTKSKVQYFLQQFAPDPNSHGYQRALNESEEWQLHEIKKSSANFSSFPADAQRRLRGDFDRYVRSFKDAESHFAKSASGRTQFEKECSLRLSVERLQLMQLVGESEKAQKILLSQLADGPQTAEGMLSLPAQDKRLFFRMTTQLLSLADELKNPEYIREVAQTFGPFQFSKDPEIAARALLLLGAAAQSHGKDEDAAEYYRKGRERATGIARAKEGSQLYIELASRELGNTAKLAVENEKFGRQLTRFREEIAKALPPDNQSRLNLEGTSLFQEFNYHLQKTEPKEARNALDLLRESPIKINREFAELLLEKHRVDPELAGKLAWLAKYQGVELTTSLSNRGIGRIVGGAVGYVAATALAWKLKSADPKTRAAILTAGSGIGGAIGGELGALGDIYLGYDANAIRAAENARLTSVVGLAGFISVFSAGLDLFSGGFAGAPALKAGYKFLSVGGAKVLARSLTEEGAELIGVKLFGKAVFAEIGAESSKEKFYKGFAGYLDETHLKAKVGGGGALAVAAALPLLHSGVEFGAQGISILTSDQRNEEKIREAKILLTQSLKIVGGILAGSAMEKSLDFAGNIDVRKIDTWVRDTLPRLVNGDYADIISAYARGYISAAIAPRAVFNSGPNVFGDDRDARVNTARYLLEEGKISDALSAVGFTGQDLLHITGESREILLTAVLGVLGKGKDNPGAVDAMLKDGQLTPLLEVHFSQQIYSSLCGSGEPTVELRSRVAEYWADRRAVQPTPQRASRAIEFAGYTTLSIERAFVFDLRRKLFEDLDSSKVEGNREKIERTLSDLTISSEAHMAQMLPELLYDISPEKAANLAQIIAKPDSRLSRVRAAVLAVELENAIERRSTAHRRTSPFSNNFYENLWSESSLITSLCTLVPQMVFKDLISTQVIPLERVPVEKIQPIRVTRTGKTPPWVVESLKAFPLTPEFDSKLSPRRLMAMATYLGNVLNQSLMDGYDLEGAIASLAILQTVTSFGNLHAWANRMVADGDGDDRLDSVLPKVASGMGIANATRAAGLLNNWTADYEREGEGTARVRRALHTALRPYLPEKPDDAGLDLTRAPEVKAVAVIQPVAASVDAAAADGAARIKSIKAEIALLSSLASVDSKAAALDQLGGRSIDDILILLKDDPDARSEAVAALPEILSRIDIKKPGTDNFQFIAGFLLSTSDRNRVVEQIQSMPNKVLSFSDNVATRLFKRSPVHILYELCANDKDAAISISLQQAERIKSNSLILDELRLEMRGKPLNNQFAPTVTEGNTERAGAAFTLFADLLHRPDEIWKGEQITQHTDALPKVMKFLEVGRIVNLVESQSVVRNGKVDPIKLEKLEQGLVNVWGGAFDIQYLTGPERGALLQYLQARLPSIETLNRFGSETPYSAFNSDKFEVLRQVANRAPAQFVQMLKSTQVAQFLEGLGDEGQGEKRKLTALLAREPEQFLNYYLLTHPELAKIRGNTLGDVLKIHDLNNLTPGDLTIIVKGTNAARNAHDVDALAKLGVILRRPSTAEELDELRGTGKTPTKKDYVDEGPIAATGKINEDAPPEIFPKLAHDRLKRVPGADYEPTTAILNLLSAKSQEVIATLFRGNIPKEWSDRPPTSLVQICDVSTRLRRHLTAKLDTDVKGPDSNAVDGDKPTGSTEKRARFDLLTETPGPAEQFFRAEISTSVAEGWAARQTSATFKSLFGGVELDRQILTADALAGRLIKPAERVALITKIFGDDKVKKIREEGHDELLGQLFAKRIPDEYWKAEVVGRPSKASSDSEARKPVAMAEFKRAIWSFAEFGKGINRENNPRHTGTGLLNSRPLEQEVADLKIAEASSGLPRRIQRLVHSFDLKSPAELLRFLTINDDYLNLSGWNLERRPGDHIGTLKLLTPLEAEGLHNAIAEKIGSGGGSVQILDKTMQGHSEAALGLLQMDVEKLDEKISDATKRAKSPSKLDIQQSMSAATAFSVLKLENVINELQNCNPDWPSNKGKLYELVELVGLKGVLTMTADPRVKGGERTSPQGLLDFAAWYIQNDLGSADNLKGLLDDIAATRSAESYTGGLEPSTFATFIEVYNKVKNKIGFASYMYEFKKDGHKMYTADQFKEFLDMAKSFNI